MDQEQDTSPFPSPSPSPPPPRRRFGSWPLSNRESEMRQQRSHLQRHLGPLRAPVHSAPSDHDDETSDDDIDTRREDAPIPLRFRKLATVVEDKDAEHSGSLESCASTTDAATTLDDFKPPSSNARQRNLITWKQPLFAACLFFLGLALYIDSRGGFNGNRHKPNDPPSQHQDFMILHDIEFKAFGVERRPGLHGSDEQVAECEQQVNRMYRHLVHTWHPDTCKYKDFMQPWQCAKMYMMVTDKVDKARYWCLNRKKSTENAIRRDEEEAEEYKEKMESLNTKEGDDNEEAEEE